MRVAVHKLWYEPVPLRTSFMFGSSVVSQLEVVHTELRVTSGSREATGIGAMTLGNAWSFPQAPCPLSQEAMRLISGQLARRLGGLDVSDDPFEAAFELRELGMEEARNAGAQLFGNSTAVPTLCALVSSSCFDMALFDAWGRLASANTFLRLREEQPGRNLMRRIGKPYRDCNPAGALCSILGPNLAIYHAVGGLDPLVPEEISDSAVDDGLPQDLRSWIARDGVWHFKLKLRGSDPDWDFHRILSVDQVCTEAVPARTGRDPVYSLDMNEQCPSPAALVELLEGLQRDVPEALARISYVEQPTARDAVGSADGSLRDAARIKPVVLDEGLTDFAAMERAMDAGYTGICLKACKGIGWSIVAAAAARSQGLCVCAQDLTCTGTAFLGSAALAAWCGMDSLEANARQFCPAAHTTAEKRRPEVFRVHDGQISTSGLDGPGMGLGLIG